MGPEKVFHDTVRKVLVVDDEPLILKSLSRGLQGNFLDVTAVSSGEEALKELSTKKFDISILDLYLPGISGMEVLEFIREKYSETKVIIITASVLEEESRRYLENNSIKIIRKPFDLTQIREILHQAFKDEGDEVSGPTTWMGPIEKKSRREPRRLFPAPLRYSINVREDGHKERRDLIAQGIDESDRGLGILTDFPLEPGQIIHFADPVPRDEGVVKWAEPVDYGYRVGIEFI
jgi:CheY-like chemotaxis protein